MPANYVGNTVQAPCKTSPQRILCTTSHSLSYILPGLSAATCEERCAERSTQVTYRPTKLDGDNHESRHYRVASDSQAPGAKFSPCSVLLENKQKP